MNTTHATNAAVTSSPIKKTGTKRPPSPTEATRPKGPIEATRPKGPTSAPQPTKATSPTNPRNALGRYGEELAARRLTETGMTVLARNWRCGRTGEIDIVARDGDTLVICEVKTRREGAFEHPMAAVTPTKAHRLNRLAACWLDRHEGPPPHGGIRIDLIGIVLPRRGAPVLTHARGVV